LLSYTLVTCIGGETASNLYLTMFHYVRMPNTKLTNISYTPCRHIAISPGDPPPPSPTPIALAPMLYYHTELLFYDNN